jgi:hypothetical protein
LRTRDYAFMDLGLDPDPYPSRAPRGRFEIQTRSVGSTVELGYIGTLGSLVGFRYIEVSDITRNVLITLATYKNNKSPSQTPLSSQLSLSICPVIQ